jgi:hypothetical protein
MGAPASEPGPHVPAYLPLKPQAFMGRVWSRGILHHHYMKAPTLFSRVFLPVPLVLVRFGAFSI